MCGASPRWKADNGELLCNRCAIINEEAKRDRARRTSK